MKKNYVGSIPITPGMGTLLYRHTGIIFPGLLSSEVLPREIVTTVNSWLYRSLTVVAEREAFGSNFYAAHVTVKQTLVPGDHVRAV